ncbi:flagellar hook-length control protein FliK [Planobispora longispora]|uniref:Flagellar hook-length control protein-like C-terminal domain-containing protein n=1 Tax=Planobispora longispora TaxID=28887 RepID=A0A8J3RW53_9ACTN|nr:flagellar hook-length control protein FliK [Planobispora longispora]GIH81042.1 hypothetical protein Plo01_74710 [Planobispora longispora]
MPSIPLAGSSSPMAAPSGASGEGQAGQTGAGDAFAALLALIAGGGPLPQGALPNLDLSGGATGSGQTAQGITALSSTPAALGAQLGVPLTIQAQLAGQDQGQALSAQLLQSGGVQAQEQQLVQASGLTGVPAVPAAVLLGGAGAPADAAALTPVTTAAAGPDAPASGTTAEGVQAVPGQDVTASAVPVATSGSGTGASSSGDGGSEQPGFAAAAVTEAAEAADVTPQAVPQVTATAQTEAVEQVAAPAPARPAPPASQIAFHVVPLRQDPDGVHRLTVHLNPVDLGPVSVVAEVRNGAVHLQLAGTSDVAFDTLRTALPELKRELEESGFSSCSLDLQREAPNGGQSGERRQAQQDAAAQQGGQSWNSAPYGGARTASATTDPVPDRPGSRLLNVRL